MVYKINSIIKNYFIKKFTSFNKKISNKNKLIKTNSKTSKQKLQTIVISNNVRKIKISSLNTKFELEP